jgi:hypothetical protein
VSHLRFSPADYRRIASACLTRHLSPRNPAAFRRRLAAALTREAPALAWRIALLRDTEIRLLCDFLRQREAPPPADRPRAKAHGLTPAEWTTFTETCAACRLPARFARAWKGMLLETLWDIAPGLARKLDRLSPLEFEGLVVQAIHDRKKG